MSGPTPSRALLHWLVSGQERGALSLALGPGWVAVRAQMLALAALLVANGVVLVAFTLPAWGEAAAVGSATRVGRQAHETLEPALARARAMYGPVLAAEDALAQLRRHVGASSGSISEIISTVRAAVDAAGMSVERVTYNPQPVPELGLLQLQIDMPVRGRYAQLRRFLRQLLDGPSFLVVERIRVSTPSEHDTRQTLMVQLSTSIFTDTETIEGSSLDVPAAAQVSELAPVTVADPVALAEALRQRLASLPPVPMSAGDFALHLERLEREQPEPEPSQRNLFAFAVDERPAPSPPAPTDDGDDGFTPEPVMPYTLLGITRTNEGLLATLSDGDDVHLLRQGELLPEGYRVASIDLVTVTLEAGDQIVSLSLRKKLSQ